MEPATIVASSLGVFRGGLNSSSFQRKLESSVFGALQGHWIPAFAGATGKNFLGILQALRFFVESTAHLGKAHDGYIAGSNE
jgi:hypothetical protein